MIKIEKKNVLLLGWLNTTIRSGTVGGLERFWMYLECILDSLEQESVGHRGPINTIFVPNEISYRDYGILVFFFFLIY